MQLCQYVVTLVLVCSRSVVAVCLEQLGNSHHIILRQMQSNLLCSQKLLYKKNTHLLRLYNEQK